MPRFKPLEDGPYGKRNDYAESGWRARDDLMAD
jgi:hypothetical protein